jgi:hypothetical protein
MLVSKEKFINYLNSYKEAWEEQCRFQSVLRPFFESPICKYRDNLMNAYEELLVDISECHDEDGIFGWWLYESGSEDKTITVKEKDGSTTKYDVSDPEGLYKYLVTYYGKAEECI